MFNLIEKTIISKLSGDIPLVKEPYKKIAEEVGVTEEEVLDKVKELKDRGVLRRVGGILYHRQAGFKYNAMVVWVIPENRIEEAAKIICLFKEVTHCYQRPTFDGWPYNLFTMVHGETTDYCENVIKQISDSIKVQDYKVLYSLRELKKSSKRYFNLSEV